MPKLRILYAASEIAPFLNTSAVADWVGKLPKYMQDQGLEVRILVPRFGVINERKNRLHEVVRLSGLDITVGDEASPLIIKVASIPQTRLQVYFIDNEAYFKRKAVLQGKDNVFFEDNDARMIFFCKGVLETAKKLEWAPDIVHCHDWFTSLIPLYLKTAYHKDPIFEKTKVLLSLYNNTFSHNFGQDFRKKAQCVGMTDQDLQAVGAADFSDLVRASMQYADHTVRAEALAHEIFKKLPEAQAATCITHDEAGMQAYHQLYQELADTR